MLEKQSFCGIDLFKIIAAYLIILLHVSVFPAETVWYDILRQMITIVAVPFFFTASGFVLSRRLRGGFPAAIKNNYVKYIVWSLIYLPFVIFGWCVNDAPIWYDITYYIRDFFLEGSYLTIWFLNALAIALLLEWILLKKLSSRTVFMISIPFFIVACLLSAYHQLLVDVLNLDLMSNFYYSVFSSTKNGLLFGFPFVALGVWISDIKTDKGVLFWSGGLFASFFALVLEVVLRNSFFPNNKSVDFAIALIPFAFFAIMVATNIPIKEKAIYLYFRRLSVLLFLTQRIFIFGFDLLDKIMKIAIGYPIVSAIPVIHFLLVAGATTLFSMLILHLCKKFPIINKIC